eukprot:TRINITY_DN67038_c0_g1_i1.p1 TRINITY_DN67038_c0_g1~~TRINITY_DN67038_c0_g1_i1.p1  ORF type:complete len:682 (+),score=58.55 TRINITY_DN67038_c0_g1_i1:127-2172(+)
MPIGILNVPGCRRRRRHVPVHTRRRGHRRRLACRRRCQRCQIGSTLASDANSAAIGSDPKATRLRHPPRACDDRCGHCLSLVRRHCRRSASTRGGVCVVLLHLVLPLLVHPVDCVPRRCSRPVFVAFGHENNTCTLQGAMGIQMRIRNFRAFLHQRAAVAAKGAVPGVASKLSDVIIRYSLFRAKEKRLWTNSWMCVPFGCSAPSKAELRMKLWWAVATTTGLSGLNIEPFRERDVTIEMGSVTTAATDAGTTMITSQSRLSSLPTLRVPLRDVSSGARGPSGANSPDKNSHASVKAPMTHDVSISPPSPIPSMSSLGRATTRRNNTGLRAAFCISGLPRGFTRRGFYNSIQRNLIDAFAAPISRVFWRIKLEESSAANEGVTVRADSGSGVVYAANTSSEPSLTVDDFAAARRVMRPVAWEAAADIRPDPPEYVERGCRSSGTWRQAKVMAECFDMVKEHEQQHGRFDVVFRVRTDSVFVRRFPHHQDLLGPSGELEIPIVVRDMFYMTPRRYADAMMDLTPHWIPVDTWGLEIVFLEAIRAHDIQIAYQCVKSACKHDWWIPPGEPGFRQLECLDFLVIARGSGDLDAFNHSHGFPPASACREDAASIPRPSCWAFPNFAYVPEAELRRVVTSEKEDSLADAMIDTWHRRPACGSCANLANRVPQTRRAIHACEARSFA